MLQGFDRKSILVFTGSRMEKTISSPSIGARGWACYPKGFFGCWKPANNTARRSMKRPKRITFLPIIGWTFDIELRIINTRSDVKPVGLVYHTPDGATGAANVRGATGFLATTSIKRVKVVHS